MTSRPDLQPHIEKLNQLALNANETNWFELVPTAIDEIELLREKIAADDPRLDGLCAAVLETFADCANLLAEPHDRTAAETARELVQASIEQLGTFISPKRVIS